MLRTVVAAAQHVGDVASNGDGSKALVVRTNGTQDPVFALVDTLTGVTLNTAMPPPCTGPFSGCLGSVAAATRDRRQVAINFVWDSGVPTSQSHRTQLLDVDTLTWGVELAVGQGAVDLTFSPDGAIAYSWSPGRYNYGMPGRFQANDVASGALVAAISGIPVSLALAFPPLAPTLAAIVTGARVDLQWTLPIRSPAVTQYVIEAGTAPGLSNLGTLALGLSETLSLPGVPPGIYLVRVRGANASGVGAASNEVTVTVP